MKDFHTKTEWAIVILAGILLGLMMSWLEITETCNDCWMI